MMVIFSIADPYESGLLQTNDNGVAPAPAALRLAQGRVRRRRHKTGQLGEPRHGSETRGGHRRPEASSREFGRQGCQGSGDHFGTQSSG